VQPQTALVIEDDADIRQLVTDILTGSGCEVHQAATGRDIEQLLREHKPDLITLDLGLPDLDGLEVCRRIRELSDAYVIMLTARAEESDRLIGLHVGADDYMSKPFSSRELRARVTALFRRPRHMVGVSANGAAAPGSPTLDAGGGLSISQDRREAKVGEQTLPLTRTEFDFLVLLASRPGQVWDRGAIVKELWQSEFHGSTHLVDVHVANLRRKLDKASPGTVWIHTVRGVGFRLDPPA
jgi:two-component system OmpR family response regulator